MSSPLAVVFVRADNGADPVKQQNACVELCLRESITIRYWAQGGPGALADALRIIDSRKAGLLVVAHPDLLGSPLAQEAIRAHLADIGGRLLIAVPGQRAKAAPPPGTELAARMAAAGMSEEVIGHVLQVDPESVRALLRQAKRHGLLGVVGLGGTWAAAKENPGRTALATAAVVATLALAVASVPPPDRPYVPPGPYRPPVAAPPLDQEPPAREPPPRAPEPPGPAIQPPEPAGPGPTPTRSGRGRGTEPAPPPGPPEKPPEHEHCLHIDPLLVNPGGCPERLQEFVGETLPT